MKMSFGKKLWNNADENEMNTLMWNKAIKNLRKKYSRKNISNNGMNFRLDVVEAKISELEDNSKKSTQNVAKRNKEIKNKRGQSKEQENRLRFQNMSNRTSGRKE